MERNKAEEVSRVVKQMERCERFLDRLQRSYRDEFSIYYNGFEACELEEDVLQMIVKHYEDKLNCLRAELAKL